MCLRHTIAADWADPDNWVDAPDDIKLETATLRAYPTPGHTRGHVVFVDASRDVMFAGDHVLPRITPSIGFEQNASELPLRDYLDSLKLVRGLPDRRLLPAHGPVSPSVHARVDELIDHHDTRLRRTEEAIEAHPGTAADGPAGCAGPDGNASSTSSTSLADASPSPRRSRTSTSWPRRDGCSGPTPTESPTTPKPDPHRRHPDE